MLVIQKEGKSRNSALGTAILDKSEMVIFKLKVNDTSANLSSNASTNTAGFIENAATCGATEAELIQPYARITKVGH
ncbi:MAG: hypothetical protein A3B82_02405 [Methylophilales bacterium RIFCSPHIGHO2_02_FULL_57_10]|nr:MAG: hypothetical protein A3B82_02405 [Methylophilales bacterium RIFCSPHIGHO2_02_FULL_57_10]